MTLNFPFFASSTLEDVALILHYTNVSILFHSIIPIKKIDLPHGKNKGSDCNWGHYRNNGTALL